METETNNVHQIARSFIPEIPVNKNKMVVIKPKIQLIPKILMIAVFTFNLISLYGITIVQSMKTAISKGTPNAAHITV